MTQRRNGLDRQHACESRRQLQAGQRLSAQQMMVDTEVQERWRTRPRSTDRADRIGDGVVIHAIGRHVEGADAAAASAAGDDRQSRGLYEIMTA